MKFRLCAAMLLVACHGQRAEGELAEETAFDLTVSERGAVLGWVATGSKPALHVLRFDVQGGAQGSNTYELVGGSAGDLALADSAAGLSVVWRETASNAAAGNATASNATASNAAVARGMWLDSAGDRRALELGAAWGEARAGRGNLALVSRGAGALALVRGPRESCEDGSEEACFGFRFYALSAGGAVETGLGLRVPVPCDARAAQLLSPLPPAEGLHYAVCTRADQAPVLTVFSIDPERSYASARQVFSGCTPLGASYFGGQPMIVAECQGARQVARITGADAPLELRPLDVQGLLCGPQGARVRIGSEWLALDQATEHLELILDSSLSPAGARAVWTGSVLLVAQVAAGKLALRRYQCAEGELRSIESPLG
ncbi:MAG: hypothetical protein ABI895_24665 [Deltaproteobacteria bacterium]